MSVSVTRTITKKNDANKVARRQREYDHLYDPVYTVSSEVDHARSNLKAYASKDRVRLVPEYESMFSNLSHHPRFTVHLDPTDLVPTSIDRRWRGHTDQRKGALQQLAGIIPTAECRVTGADSWKYFKRPLIPFAQQVPPDVIFALPKEQFASSGGKNAEKQPTHFTVGVQTDYRESETQTDPYSSEYVVQPGTSPSELLRLAALTWGCGLPVGLAEVEMIERARAKRAWEATLPPLDDLSQLDKRRRMMEEMEVKEWAFREGEIQKLQETRLFVLKDLLRQRDEAQKEVTNDRLNQIYSKNQKDKESKLDKIQNDYMRELRKLDAKGRNMEWKLDRLGVIKELKDSQAVSPQSRSDKFSNRITRNKEFKSHYLDTYEGLVELEAGISDSVLKPQGKKTKPKARILKSMIKPPVCREVDLMMKYKALKEEREQEECEQEKSSRFLLKTEKPVVRPVTPRVEEPPEGDEERELAVIHLQKLLRGRSIQYEMFEGKENHLDLIHELRTVHALQREEQELQKADKGLVMSLKKQRDKHRHESSQEEASQARVVGAELEHIFDTLSKELIHLQEERRIHAFTLLAERDRRLREAEESGRRQVEERRRREEDEIFRQVVQVHQETVDLYLEDIILGTLEQTADEQAREEIRRRAKEVNDIAYAMEESRNNLQSEEIVSELVYSFLIPEVEKIIVRQRVHQRQHRHLQATRSIIQGTAEHSGILPITLGASQSSCPSERASNRVLEEVLGPAEQEKGKQTE
ncbi:Cilia- and flagella-associated protein 91 [Dissostichus eleginoides]|uniref:Cilia- and flagella-associated protein 91 n=1 Tax=Dissostichus eleginoides TaxID=100907 RepID=A0AAD9FKY7_DISEL|nr:Cilia- and flagella-associated protein 91 [Dissostichus eleginoides]